MLDNWQQTDKGKNNDANTVNVSGKDCKVVKEILHISNVLLIQMLHLKTQSPAVRLRKKRVSGGAIELKKRTSFLTPDKQTVGRPNQTSVCAWPTEWLRPVNFNLPYEGERICYQSQSESFLITC